MASQVLFQGMVAQCPHGGSVMPIATSQRVCLSGQPALVLSDPCLVAGCAFILLLKPQPCIRVQWLMGAQRVQVSGQPVLLGQSSGLCQSAEQIPQGPPSVINTQSRVRGT